MKKVILTVDHLLFLTKVYHAVGFGSIDIRDILDANQNQTASVEVELPDEDIEGIADSIQEYIEKYELPDEDLTTANEILELIGAMPF